MLSSVPAQQGGSASGGQGVRADNGSTASNTGGGGSSIQSNWVTFDVYTDRSEYRVGEEARITAVLSSNYADVDDAEVWAEVEYPSGVTQHVGLEEGICSATGCICPSCPEGAVCEPCHCDSTASCQYWADITVSQTGTHYITAFAKADGTELYEKAKFTGYASSETEYVRLDQKFDLEEGQSAVVVNYGDMRMTLDYIGLPVCPTVDSNAEYYPCDSVGYVLLTVRAPLYPTKESTTTNNEVVAYSETQVRINDGTGASVFGADISLLNLESDEATFIVSKQGDGNYVDVKIEPTSMNVELGDEAEYYIMVKDLHSAYSNAARGYKYKVSVLDLPFALDYDREITLSSGAEGKIRLGVDTSAIIAALTYESAESEVASAVPAAVALNAHNANVAVQAREAKMETAQVQAAVANQGAVQPATATVSSAAATETVEVAPSVVTSGRYYKFRVLVTGSDGSQATAYAILNILYSPPPPPGKIRLDMEQGWNLIALPGKGSLHQGSCSGEMYAFVYLRDEGRYVTIEEAEDIMGAYALEEYLRLNSYWVYSFNDCYLEFGLEDATGFNELSLGEGWNFVPITQDMKGNSLNDIGGDCNFDRVYYWDAERQDWKNMGNGEKFSESQLYTGFVAKVTDSCDFGWGAIISPPELPG